MITFDEFRKLALSFPDTEEHPHFEKPSYRWKGKIFSTYWENEHLAMVRLTPVDQSVYCDAAPGVFYPVPNAWGKQGATLVDLAKVKKSMLKDALALAYEGVKPSARKK